MGVSQSATFNYLCFSLGWVLDSDVWVVACDPPHAGVRGLGVVEREPREVGAALRDLHHAGVRGLGAVEREHRTH